MTLTAGIKMFGPQNFFRCIFREAFELKNVTKSGKIPQGGGVSKKHQKVQNSKFGLFDKRGGRPYFHFFPKFKCTLKILQLKKK